MSVSAVHILFTVQQHLFLCSPVFLHSPKNCKVQSLTVFHVSLLSCAFVLKFFTWGFRKPAEEPLGYRRWINKTQPSYWLINTLDSGWAWQWSLFHQNSREPIWFVLNFTYISICDFCSVICSSRKGHGWEEPLLKLSPPVTSPLPVYQIQKQQRM